MSGCVKVIGAALALSIVGAAAALAGETPARKTAKVYIVWPKDGQVIVGGKFWLRMGARDIGVVPSGVVKANVGHHHAIIDAPLPPFDEEIPADKNHLHFGGGQTEVRIELPPGRHTLQLLMGDHEHIPHNPPLYSPQITVIVP